MIYVLFRSLLIYLLWGLFPVFLFSQGDFHLQKGKEKEVVRFDFINNLMIVPIEVNGVELSFIVDTGVNKPILFNLSENDSVSLRNFEEITIKGLGDGEAIQAIKSSGNTFRIGEIYNPNQEIYILMDTDINLSPRLGIAVNGIIGYDLFENFVVEVNYNRARLEFHRPDTYTYRNCRKCETHQMDIVANKPFIKGFIDLNESQDLPVYLLVDTGSTDALWLFEDEKQGINVPEKYFDDYIGRGLSGDVYGKRSRVRSFAIGDFELEQAKVAFPDSASTQNLKYLGTRNGSVGNEIIKRFNLVFDYPNRKITLRKNRFFNDPFKYNMSGIELQHNGLRLVREISGSFNHLRNKDENSQGITFDLQRNYSIELHPALEIAELRENSPAKEVGLRKGDVILSVNGTPVHRFSIQELREILNEKPGKKLKLRIQRDGKELQFAFQLKKVL
ncbi:aspartyl protease family protein [Robertkochia aurantiaca]|uniref:aspartyl protease family protein n=1 Tax=Robertkochia aurantiaca TaxID=2873700 RepID=UPI001CCEC212|nr:aspartyl protease family protein [Robertkochia sp. 3YJGBD-33]